MKRFRGALCWIVMLTVIVPVGYRATGWLLRYDWRPKTDALASEAGRDLFLHEWTPGDPLAAEATVWDPSSTRRLAPAATNKGESAGAGRRNITSPSLPERPNPAQALPTA